MKKINKYIFYEIVKGSLLVLFIFLTVAWLLQFTRLLSLTNLVQVDIITILYLSMFLVPNLITVIMPFVVMFGLIISFLKLHKDRELITIYSLGFNINSIIKPLTLFSFILLFFLILLNFYLSPKIYKNYKIKEHEIRNKINFEKIVISNFIKINQDTFLDFKKNNQKFEEVFIKFSENKENMIFAEEANIKQYDDKFIFELINGFKITFIESGKIEKLEFDKYSLELKNNSFQKYNNFDNNTFDIFEDLKNKNYNNIIYKTTDSLIVIIILIFFYFNNIKIYRFDNFSLIIFLSTSLIFLILNQIYKNLSFTTSSLTFFFVFILMIIFSYLYFFKKNA